MRTKTKNPFFLVKKVFGKLFYKAEKVPNAFGQLFAKQFSLKKKIENCLAFLNIFFVFTIY